MLLQRMLAYAAATNVSGYHSRGSGDGLGVLLGSEALVAVRERVAVRHDGCICSV